jgi:xanthine dehydrogenase iron-sulfur cluster and FAD-binding subunit A
MDIMKGNTYNMSAIKKPPNIGFPRQKDMVGDAIRCNYCNSGIIPTGYTYYWYDKDEEGNKIFNQRHTRIGLCRCFKNEFYNKGE